MSGNQNDSRKLGSLGKAKTEINLKRMAQKVSKKRHTFLQVGKGDYDRIISRKFIGNVTASLAEDFLPLDLERFHLFIDGKLESSFRLYTRDLIADIFGFSKKQIRIDAGGKYDKKYPIVNMADGMARYYFRMKFSASQLAKNTSRRELQYFD